MSEMTRKQYYQQLGMAKTKLIKDNKLTEGDYRGMLACHGAEYHNGRYSASSLSGAELKIVLQKLKDLGWQDTFIRQKRHLKIVNTPQQKMVWALWFQLKSKGEIKSIRVQALNAWLAKWSNGEITKIGMLSEHPKKAVMVIEYLKKWLARVEKA